MSATREYTAYDAIGSAATPATLTTAYTGNQKVLAAKYMPNVHLDFKFTPGTTNEYVLLLLEVSNDEGTTFFPVSNVVYATTETDVYADSGTGSTASGMPMIVPGDKTSTVSTAISGYVDFTSVFSHIRISAKSSVGSAFGTVYVRASFLS